MVISSTLAFHNAPIVKWISCRSSEPLLGVRIPLGAQIPKPKVKTLGFVVFDHLEGFEELLRQI